jgi:hypothetical protein
MTASFHTIAIFCGIPWRIPMSTTVFYSFASCFIYIAYYNMSRAWVSRAIIARPCGFCIILAERLVLTWLFKTMFLFRANPIRCRAQVRAILRIVLTRLTIYTMFTLWHPGGSFAVTFFLGPPTVLHTRTLVLIIIIVATATFLDHLLGDTLL